MKFFLLINILLLVACDTISPLGEDEITNRIRLVEDKKDLIIKCFKDKNVFPIEFKILCSGSRPRNYETREYCWLQDWTDLKIIKSKSETSIFQQECLGKALSDIKFKIRDYRLTHENMYFGMNLDSKGGVIIKYFPLSKK